MNINSVIALIFITAYNLTDESPVQTKKNLGRKTINKLGHKVILSRKNRAVFDLIPDTNENTKEDEVSRNPCSCHKGRMCFRDKNFVCRSSLSLRQEKLMLDALEKRIRRKHRHQLRKMFRKWLKQEIQR